MSRARPAKSVIAKTFIAHSLELRTSPAWRALPDNARRVLDRLELEHMQHAGGRNGTLICTFDDFAKNGIRRKKCRPRDPPVRGTWISGNDTQGRVGQGS